jgi:hypothetical protein
MTEDVLGLVYYFSIIIPRLFKGSPEKLVFCVDDNERYRSKINKSLPRLHSSRTPARLKLIVTAASIQVNMVGY